MNVLFNFIYTENYQLFVDRVVSITFLAAVIWTNKHAYSRRQICILYACTDIRNEHNLRFIINIYVFLRGLLN